MPKKIVRIIHNGKVIGEYPIVLGGLNAEISHQEFIEQAKRNFVEDHPSDNRIDTPLFRITNK